jgi:predicted GTPase
MFSQLFGAKSEGPTVRLVVGLNQVDKIGPGDWNTRLNLPSPEQEESIERRCKDVIAKLSSLSGLAPSHLEFYSATKRYRLLPLLASVIRHTYAGFKLDQVTPADPFELAEPDVRAYAEERRLERGETAPKMNLAELRKHLSQGEFEQLSALAGRERRRPPKVALLGKAGVGKTTTINSLFNANWKNSHALVGTKEAQAKEFELESGGRLTAIDLPGYGRSRREDEAYERIYREVLPGCDVVLLVIQADTRDMSDDQEVLCKLADWMKSAPVPQRVEVQP